MPVEVSDKFSNLNDHIANAAKILCRSEQRRRVFRAIYDGKRQIKTKKEISRKTKLSEIRVLQEGRTLANNHLVDKVKVGGETAFKKLNFYSQYKVQILRFANSPRKLKNFPTKINPTSSKQPREVIVRYPSKAFDVMQLTIDDIDSFSAVRKVAPGGKLIRHPEKRFKNMIQRIIGEHGKFSDWGGEKNDLYTTRIRINGKRVSSAFAFKGKGLKGVLKPNRMGKNGDQIPRLFQTDAKVFILQYWGQIDQSVYELMNRLAISRSAIFKEKIFYCVIDGTDTERLCRAYANKF